MRSLAHPNRLAALRHAFPSTCAIQRATESRGATGEVILSWGDAPGMTAIPCRVAPTGGREVKRENQTYVVATHYILLRGYYGGISERDRAVVGSQVYNILLVEHDGEQSVTRLECEVIR